MQEPKYKRCRINGVKSGDGIEFGGHCYLFFDKMNLDWNEAQEICSKINGSNLLSIVSLNEMQFIRNYTLFRFNSSEFWIGLYAKTNSSEVHFQWSDGSAVKKTFWEQKQPSIDTKNSSSSCVYHSSNTNQWRVDFCINKKHFICKSSDGSKSSNAKNYAKYGCPSFAGSVDSKFNWINIDDNLELCYWFSADFGANLMRTTWTEAALKCHSLNSTLVSIHSMESLMKMKNKIKRNTWIGLTQTETGIY